MGNPRTAAHDRGREDSEPPAVRIPTGQETSAVRTVGDDGPAQALESACAEVLRAVDSRYRHRLQQLRQREVTGVLASIPLLGGGTLLEVGCGDGFQIGALASRFNLAVGSDRSRGRYGGDRGRFVQCVAEALPFRPRSFDLVFTSNVLEHLTDRDGALQEMKAVLRDGGMMIHTLPTSFWKLVSLVLYPIGVLALGLRVIFAALGVASAAQRRSPCAHSSLTLVPRILGTVVSSYVVRRPDACVGAAVAASGARARMLGVLLRILRPSVHGTYRSHLEEWSRYRRKAWRALFEAHQLRVVHEVELGCYTEYALLGERFLSLRGALTRWGFSSCRAYVVRDARDRGERGTGSRPAAVAVQGPAGAGSCWGPGAASGAPRALIPPPPSDSTPL